MSIETWSFPNNTAKKDLERFLISLGYESFLNPFFPGPSGSIHFSWFNPVDFQSTTGVDASIFPIDSARKKVLATQSDLGIWTRTSASASSFDQEFQNKTVRAARKKYGGFFFNDHYGRNRYNVIERPSSTPVSRGLYFVYRYVVGNLEGLVYVLPKEINTVCTPSGDITEENDPHGIVEATRKLGLARVLYNALVPFVVASFEHFFSQSFQILLKYDSEAMNLLMAEKRKVSLEEAASLAAGTTTLEKIVSDWYSFQNIDSIHKAFSQHLSFDFWRLIRQRKKVSGRLPLLSEALDGLINARHGIVHHFSIDSGMSKENLLELIELVKTVIDLFCGEIERKHGVKLGPG